MNNLDEGVNHIAAAEEGARAARVAFECRGNQGSIHLIEKEVAN
jgi:hypothetical protein